VPTNLAQAHNADTDFPVTHLATSVSAEIKLPGFLLFYTRGLEKSINFVTSESNQSITRIQLRMMEGANRLPSLFLLFGNGCGPIAGIELGIG
jgi:hypothetical protein